MLYFGTDPKSYFTECALKTFIQTDTAAMYGCIRDTLLHSGVRPVHQMSTCLTQLTLGSYVVTENPGFEGERNPRTPPCGHAFWQRLLSSSSSLLLSSLELSDTKVYEPPGTEPLHIYLCMARLD